MAQDSQSTCLPHSNTDTNPSPAEHIPLRGPEHLADALQSYKEQASGFLSEEYRKAKLRVEGVYRFAGFESSPHPQLVADSLTRFLCISYSLGPTRPQLVRC